jgi:UDP-galactose transporter B1
MARVKQATPLRRDPSSEFISREDRSPRSAEKTSNGTTNGHTNGSLLKALAPKPAKEAGLLQLLIGAGGIYGSLSVIQALDLPICIEC